MEICNSFNISNSCLKLCHWKSFHLLFFFEKADMRGKNLRKERTNSFLLSKILNIWCPPDFTFETYILSDNRKKSVKIAALIEIVWYIVPNIESMIIVSCDLQMRGIQRPACFHTRKMLIEEHQEDTKIARHNLDPRNNTTIVARTVSQ